MDFLNIRNGLANIKVRARDLIENGDIDIQTAGWRIKDIVEDLTKEIDKLQKGCYFVAPDMINVDKDLGTVVIEEIKIERRENGISTSSRGNKKILRGDDEE